MKKIGLFVVIISVVFFNCTQCTPDNDECGNTALEFDLPLQVFGNKDTLNVDDTLTLALKIPDVLTERNRGFEYELIDYNFKLVNYVVKIDSMSTTSESARDFYWVVNKGLTQYVSGAFLVLPEYSNHVYEYEAKVIPKAKGLYVFGMNSDYSGGIPLEKVNGPCSNRAVEIFVKLEDDSNSNFEFLKLSPDPIQNNIDKKRFQEFAGFCFFVR